MCCTNRCCKNYRCKLATVATCKTKNRVVLTKHERHTRLTRPLRVHSCAVRSRCESNQPDPLQFPRILSCPSRSRLRQVHTGYATTFRNVCSAQRHTTIKYRPRDRDDMTRHWAVASRFSQEERGLKGILQ